MVEYLHPASTEEAIALLADFQGHALLIAGGTDVLPDIHKGKVEPRYLVDITRIPGLDQIVVTGRFVKVGAAVTFAALAESPFLNRHVPALAEAARSVGAMGIRTAATWVGNIVQGMPAADGGIVAVALEAEARVKDRDGAEWRPVESLFLGPGRTAIDPSRQLITHLRFPVPQSQWGTAWERVGRRESLVLPILNCAVKMCLRDSGVEKAVIALGPVAPRPFRARRAESFLIDRPPTAQALAEAGRIAQGESNPRSSVLRGSREYRLSIIPPLVSDALKTALERAQSATPRPPSTAKE